MDSKQIKDVLEKSKHLRVLYAEDDLDVRKQTIKMLELYFKEVIECANGNEGVLQFKDHDIDLIFTDINMPSANGLKMIREIKSLNENVPVIIFSAYDNPSYFIEAIELGVNGYLLKPFQLKDMLRLIQKIVKSDEKIHCFKMIDGFCWDRDTFSLFKGNEKIKLSAKETLLLNLLTSSKQRVFSSIEIENEVFDDDICDNKRVRNLVNRFRSKVKSDLIESIYSQGYKLKWKV